MTEKKKSQTETQVPNLPKGISMDNCKNRKVPVPNKKK